jgi:FMN phosphatase YigB (HAD superfamily)
MPQSLAEYAQWLSERDLRWPAPPKFKRAKAAPHADPLPGIRAVFWNLYGTLIRISDGELLHLHPESVRMEVALEKTIHEFNMWQSMTRRPGAPWQYLLTVYRRIVEELRLVGSNRVGDVPEVDSATVWRKILDMLGQKEYAYDVRQYGDLDELSEKVAYFFHTALQGHEASPESASALTAVSQAGVSQGLLADAQCFSMVQLVRDLRQQDPSVAVTDLFRPELVVLSYKERVRKPSMGLFAAAYKRLQSLSIEPQHVLYVGSRVAGDLAVAKSIGFRTAIYAGEKLGLSVTLDELQDPNVCPDRMLTKLSQIRDVLSL